jgi:hypothetical protein
MTNRPPLAAPEDVPLEQLAAAARVLADRLVAAARSGLSSEDRPRLQLVGANDQRLAGDESLATRTRCYLRARRLRECLFPGGIFADPAWDMLLDLFACHLEGETVCVSDACVAAGVPTTTALRWVSRLEEAGLIERRPDTADCRRIIVELKETAIWRLQFWLEATFEDDGAS